MQNTPGQERKKRRGEKDKGEEKGDGKLFKRGAEEQKDNQESHKGTNLKYIV